MPFVTQTFEIPQSQKAFLWLMQTLQCSQKEAQKILDKHRLTQNDLPIHKSQEILGKVKLKHFIPSQFELPKILQTPYFVIYDKPHKLLTHPKGIYPHLSLCDALKFEFGLEANPIHRLDSETAGLLLCSISKKYETPLKLLFEQNLVKKTYLARVKGKISHPLSIDKPIAVPPKNAKHRNLAIRSFLSPLGKPSQTDIKPLSYDAHSHTTLLEVKPITGRTHQIRLHLSSIGHPILGDPLYGCKDCHAKDYLEKELNDEERKEFFDSPFLQLCAHTLEFTFLDTDYKAQSKLGALLLDG